MKRHIVLCGMMGAGKSTVGRLLSERLDRPFFDSDQVIAGLEKKTIREVFQIHDEAYFRAKEFAVISQLLDNPKPAVLSLGGGALMNRDTVSKVKTNGTLVYLKTSLDILKCRIGSDSARPLLENASLDELFEARKSGYEAANIIVATDEQTPEVSVDAVLEAIQGSALRDN